MFEKGELMRSGNALNFSKLGFDAYFYTLLADGLCVCYQYVPRNKHTDDEDLQNSSMLPVPIGIGYSKQELV